ncbi:SH3 domain-containing protein [Flavobacterium sp. W21_SRS_FM6]|uniref:SH3 domain-containing protein n=1 Tax=Flavobacterium sp. W21_SRS_FM6 TaxID=3240268 RepID=UPI003F921BFE
MNKQSQGYAVIKCKSAGLWGICLLLLCWSFNGHAEAPIQVQVRTAYVDMRSGPAGGYPVIAVAKQGQWLTVLKQRTAWFKVENEKGQQGWISQDDLHLTLDSNLAPVKLSDGSFEDFSQRQFEVGAMAGSFDGVPSISVIGNWLATENIALGINITQAVGTYSENQLALVNIRHNAFPEWRLAPYFVVSAGKIWTSPKGSLVQSGDEKRSANVLSAGLGLRYYLARNFLVKLEYNSLLVKTDRDTNEELAQWQLGFAVFF